MKRPQSSNPPKKGRGQRMQTTFWPIHDFKLVPIVMDGVLGEYRTFFLVVDGIMLSNDTSKIDVWVDSPLRPKQVLICGCGQEGCALGNYVCLRRIGDSVAWVPAYFDCDDSPPDYIAERGIPLFPAVVWNQLRREIISVPWQSSTMRR
jgi:hypothetical protein